MCIIVDTDCLGKFFKLDDQDSEPIHRWLKKGGKLVYSEEGGFESEMKSHWRSKLKTYAQRGFARLILHDEFKKMENELRESVLLKSDDPHILALAIDTGARLLFTADKSLMIDFKNQQILNNPRGKVYSSRSNSDLLDRSKCKT